MTVLVAQDITQKNYQMRELPVKGILSNHHHSKDILSPNVSELWYQPFSQQASVKVKVEIN